jgi:hypothetical protein
MDENLKKKRNIININIAITKKFKRTSSTQETDQEAPHIYNTY